MIAIVSKINCQNQQHNNQNIATSRTTISKKIESFKKKVYGGAIVGCVGISLMLAPRPSFAFKEKIAEFDASGFLFKDSIEVVALSDPDIKGVTVYFSDFKRSLKERLSKDFFTDPSQTSVTCALTGSVDQAALQQLAGSSGQEIFAEQKGFNIFKNKTVRVRRIYDEKRNTLLYVSYSTRISSADEEGGPSAGRYRSSLCALPLPSADGVPIAESSLQ